MVMDMNRYAEIAKGVSNRTFMTAARVGGPVRVRETAYKTMDGLIDLEVALRGHRGDVNGLYAISAKLLETIMAIRDAEIRLKEMIKLIDDSIG